MITTTQHIVIDLDFDSTSHAHAFAAFLHNNVWGTSNSPALVGTPMTRILVRPADDNHSPPGRVHR